MSIYLSFSEGDAMHQLQSSPNLEKATRIVIERARQLVRQLVDNRGNDEPPFLPEEFARLQGVKRIVKTDFGKEIKESAVLLKLDDGYVIKVNQNHNLARQNFSCAHEIGHILLRDLKLEPYIQSIEYRTLNPQGHAIVRATARERLCDSAATELLMPELVFIKYLSRFGVSVHSIEQLANTFRVSIQAAAIRIAEVSVKPCITLLWQPRPRNKSKSLKLAWCVGPGIKVSGKAHYMPVHTNIRYPSVLHEAYEYDNPVECFKLFKCGNDVTRLPMESKGFGRGEKRYVVSLAFLNE